MWVGKAHFLINIMLVMCEAFEAPFRRNTLKLEKTTDIIGRIQGLVGQRDENFGIDHHIKDS